MVSINNLQIFYHPADEVSARAFLNWRYEPPYDIYNCPPELVEEFVQYNADPANNVYAMYNQYGEMVGFCSYGEDARVPGGDYHEEALDIGMMIRPDLTGQGFGATFAADVIRNGIETYAPQNLRVTIAAFNKRAIRVWKKNGFRRAHKFKRSPDGMQFIVMMKKIERKVR